MVGWAVRRRKFFISCAVITGIFLTANNILPFWFGGFLIVFLSVLLAWDSPWQAPRRIIASIFWVFAVVLAVFLLGGKQFGEAILEAIFIASLMSCEELIPFFRFWLERRRELKKVNNC